MSRDDLWKWLVLMVLAVISAVAVIPPKEKIRTGIDLSGGAVFTVAIDQERLRGTIKAEDPNQSDEQIQAKINERLSSSDARTVEIIRNRIDKLGINEPVIQAGKEHRINIQLPGITEKERKDAEKSIQEAAFLEFKLVHPKNSDLVRELLASGRAPEGYVSDGSHFKRAPDYENLTKADPEYFQRLSLFEVKDPRHAFMLEPVIVNPATKEVAYAPVFVLRKAELDGTALASSSVSTDPLKGVAVNLKFNSKGAAKFKQVTGKHVGRDLAIIMDDTLYSAPTIKTEISTGSAQITGRFTVSEANRLSGVLNAGALPAPMKIIEKRVTDPTLGKDAVASGIYAGIGGIVLVMGFMLVYYAYCGLIANIALVLNLLLLPAGLIFAANILGVFVKDVGAPEGLKGMLTLPVLTLPGIAGIVLTLGMAVDANVLIFERIREEFATGKSVRAAIAAGYDRAFLAIFDSNLTTLLTAAILFIFGAGPIRGYAITLSAGIIISMFTALVVTRLIFNATAPADSTKPYTMLQMFKSPSFDFLKPAKLCVTTSLAIIVVTCAWFGYKAFTKPSSVMTVDFVGGAAITYACKEKAPVSEVRGIVDGIVIDSTIQYQSMPGAEDMLLVMTSQPTVGSGDSVTNSSTVILAALNEKFPQSGFHLSSEETVGAVVGADLKRAAFWATLLSLIGILIYISLRFEFGFALGAVVALTHDALITLGLYSLLGYQMSLTTIAALLTIVGYSVNDTIVVFDRIREDLRRDPKMEFKELCNRAINTTLSRTVLTSLTTILAALALFLFGGGAINDFALAMLIGLVAGTYSSIFIATPVMLAWYRGHRPAFFVRKED